jgi:hypothetical protein
MRSYENEHIEVIPSVSLELASLFQAGGPYEGQSVEVNPYALELIKDSLTSRHSRIADGPDEIYDSETINVAVVASGETVIPADGDKDSVWYDKTNIAVELDGQRTDFNQQVGFHMHAELLKREKSRRMGPVGSTLAIGAFEGILLAPAVVVGSVAEGPGKVAAMGVATIPALMMNLPGRYKGHKTQGLASQLAHQYRRLRALKDGSKANQREFERPEELASLAPDVIRFQER